MIVAVFVLCLIALLMWAFYEDIDELTRQQIDEEDDEDGFAVMARFFEDEA